MKTKFFYLIISFALLFTGCDVKSKFKYETVPNDPLKARIYTLDNGLKIYLSVNKDKPRIQTYIGVRVGSKNDPAETTGLAHYFEHLMFKGTQQFGTSDFEAEKPMLNQIEQLFEEFRKTTDEGERKTIYAKIDSVSQLASQIAIPNEYDKLMSAIGASGTNAFTSYDVTAYVENIPSNEIENWAKIQADRFTNPVIRLFHTELETVYEEFNMGLTSDGGRVWETMMSALFPHHPYGTQTVIGTREHLKNPSITNIKKYFDTYYVPNNMVVCMVGDFDFDATVLLIDRYFGSMKAKDLPELKTEEEAPIEAPIEKEVIGLEAENVTIAYRFPAANTDEVATLQFIDYLLTNGKAGLIDLNLVQQQRVLSAESGLQPLADYSVFLMQGYPKQGQTLAEVRDLLLEQINILKKGDFDERLLEAVINNFKLNSYYQQQYPEYAANLLLNSYINNEDWKQQVNKINFQSKLTKQNIIDFCNNNFKENYVVVYKREGNPNLPKIEKPVITPISTNRDNESPFLVDIKTRSVRPIEPVFVDYSKDMSKLTAKQNIEVLYKQNEDNPLFSLYYVFEMGNNNDKTLGLAFEYMKYLGTSKKSAEEINSELYRLACDFNVVATNERVYVYVKGLNDNFEQAKQLLEDRLSDAVPNQEAFDNLVADVLKKRADAKLGQDNNLSALYNYGIWGAKSPSTNILSEQELKGLTAEVLVEKIKSLKNFQHRVLYYGPLDANRIVDQINKTHVVADVLQPVPPAIAFAEQETSENKVLLANYDAKQIQMVMLNKGGGLDKDIEPARTLFNAYFGGGMNSIVFQEMREARALAYSAWATYSAPAKIDRSYYLMAFIGTQNDKMNDAVSVFNQILNDMPESEKAFDIAKEGIISNISTQRILREDVLWNYLSAIELGYDKDPRINIFEKVPALTLTDVKNFQQKYIKNKPYTYCILGDVKDLDMTILNKLGKVTILTQKDIFGY